MTRQMFITDYDGTLLTDERTFHPHDLKTLARLQEKGVFTVIATGRSFFSFQRSLEALDFSLTDLPVDYLIFSTGAGIMDLARGRLLRSLDLSGRSLSRACDYFDKAGYDYMIHQPVPDTPYFLYKDQGGDNPDFYARIALYPSFGTPVNHGTPMFERATEVLAIVPRANLRHTLEEIQNDLPGTSVIFATSPLDHLSVWIEVFHPEVSKSRSADWLCQQLGIDPELVTAVGNDYNDLDLLAWAGTGIMVANAPEEIRKAFLTVGPNNACGVSEAAAGLLDRL